MEDELIEKRIKRCESMIRGINYYFLICGIAIAIPYVAMIVILIYLELR